MWLERYPERTPDEVGAYVDVNTAEYKNGDLPPVGAEHIYDYIIIGGGTAGCVLANRLSASPSTRVLLLERGRRLSSIIERIPLLSANFLRSGAPKEVVPCSVPSGIPDGDGKWTEWDVVQGKALGGTTRINSMLYTRGAVGEWNGWKERGCEGWSYEEIEPYFKKSEKASGALAGRNWHGTEGCWNTCSFDRFFFSHLEKTINACESLNLPFIPDVNSRDHPAYGCAAIDVTHTPSGERCAADSAFLPLPLVKQREGRLKIATRTLVDKIAFGREKEGQDPRAVGVYFQHDDRPKSDRVYFARAKKEIIVCAGAIGSPKILQLSGIGSEHHLQSLGIPVVKDLPGVGMNLQDHVGVVTTYTVPIRDSMDRLLKQPFFALLAFLQYLLFGTGLLLFPMPQLSIFARSSVLDSNSRTVMPDPAMADCTDPENTPDIEIIPMALNQTFEPLPRGRGAITFLSCLIQPRSRGAVWVTSTDPRAPPKVDLGFFSAPEDWVIIRKALDLARSVAEGIRLIDDNYKMEPLRVLSPDASEDDLKAYVSQTARTSYHYTSTCRMAKEDDRDGPGVVDSRLKVHGVRGLRIADASIMPRILATHTQAPVVCIAEKCADMILQDNA